MYTGGGLFMWCMASRVGRVLRRTRAAERVEVVVDGILRALYREPRTEVERGCQG